MSRVKVGLVGCGTIAGIMHLPGLQTMTELGKVELVAVCDAIPEKAKTTAEKWNVPLHFSDLQAMLDTAAFDVLVNLTPIPEHFAVSLSALRAGRHVYTQKPMASTLAEATGLIDEARARGLKLACAPEHPVRQSVRKLRALVANGAIGK